MLNEERKILILAATQLEIGPLIEIYKPKPLVEDILYRSRNRNCTIDFLITGVGLMSSAFTMGKYMDKEFYDVMMQLGIAGSLTNQVRIGDVVCVKSDVVADEGVQREQWLSLWDMGLAYKGGKSSVIECPYVSEFELFGDEVLRLSLGMVNGISVNTITPNPIKAEELSNRFQAQIETMEGASFFYAASKQNKVPYLALRSISNVVGADRSEWDIPMAIDRVNQSGMKILQHLTQY